MAVDTKSHCDETLALIRENIPRVRAAAHRMHKRTASLVAVDDLMSAGLMALYDAARKYDPKRGSFAHYLRMRLRWAMLTVVGRHDRPYRAERGIPAGLASRYLDDKPRKVRVTPIQEEMFLPSLLEFRGDRRTGAMICSGDLSGAAVCREDNPELVFLKRELDDAVRAVIHELPRVERTILTLHYFLGEKFAVVARLLHLTRARVSQLHRQGLNRCATLLRERGYEVSLDGANG